MEICNKNCSRCSNYYKLTDSCQSVFMKPMGLSMIKISEILKHTKTCNQFSDKNYEDALRIDRANNHKSKPKDHIQTGGFGFSCF